MVEPRAILTAIRAGIEGADPDGRYALEGEVFRTTWIASPDQEDLVSPRDLLFQTFLGGCQIDGQGYEYDLAVVIVLARYSGERTSYLSGDALTAHERIHGAGLHMLALVPAIDIPGCAIAPVGHDAPIPSKPPDYLTMTCFFRLFTG